MTFSSDATFYVPTMADNERTERQAPYANRADINQSGNELCMRIVEAPADLQALGPDWDALFARAGRPEQVFQTHPFTSLFTSIYGPFADPGRCDCKLAVVTAWRGARLVLIWPLVVHRTLGGRMVSWLGEPVSQYGDALIDPVEPQLPILQAAYDEILTAVRPDLLRLRKVRADASVAPLLTHLGIAPSEPEEAPIVMLKSGGSAFEDRQSGKAKKNRRRLMRRLEERGTVEFKELSDPAANPGLGI